MNRPATAFNFEFIGDSIRPDYRTLPKDIRVGLYVLQRGRFSFANEEACRILGVDDAAALMKLSFWALVHPEDRHLVRLCQNATALPPEDPPPFRMVKPDGKTVWVAMQGHNTTINGRRANLGYIIDMRSVRYLKQSLKKYRARITMVEDVVAEVDLSGNIRSYTRAAGNLWGVNGNEMVGRNYRSVMEKSSADIVRQAYGEVFETGVPRSNIIYEILRADGQRRVVEDSVALIRDRYGRPSGFRMVSRDITRQKETEQQSAEQSAHLEAIFRSVHDAIITVDPDFSIIDANTATRTICGVDLCNAAGESLPEHLHRCSARCLNVVKKTLTDKRNIDNYLVECKHEQNLRQIVNVSCSALLHPGGRFMGAVLVLRNETRRYDLEKALEARHRYHQLIGKSKKMQEIYSLIEDLADLDTTVLITGESGTGKNLAAGALHRVGARRSENALVTVNCSALAESLLESELFGHVKGAFTGAIADKKGRFEAADGGTILLDEIGDLSQPIQLKLLKVLQEKEIERVGESNARKVDVRIIACTNKDLMQRVQSALFREDLYYRLKVVEIAMPALRERQDDIPLLIEHFCGKFNVQFDRKVLGVSDDALARLLDYDWPGNVRELEHALERAFIICHETIIDVRHLPKEIVSYKTRPLKPQSAETVPENGSAGEVKAALDKAYWNRTRAAQMLGISRQTLYRKMKACDLIE